MGLKERRAAKAFQDANFGSLKERILAAAKCSLELEVEWETLAEAGWDHMYEEAWPKVYFQPLVQALESLCQDAMGAEAVKETLKKVKIQNRGDCSNGERWASLDKAAGLLTLNHKPFTNIDEVERRAQGLVATLEQGL